MRSRGLTAIRTERTIRIRLLGHRRRAIARPVPAVHHRMANHLRAITLPAAALPLAEDRLPATVAEAVRPQVMHREVVTLGVAREIVRAEVPPHRGVRLPEIPEADPEAGRAEEILAAGRGEHRQRVTAAERLAPIRERLLRLGRPVMFR